MTMILHAVLPVLCLQAVMLAVVESAKQQVQLSDSYLPVAMQVIAHLTDQMAFEARDEATQPTPKPTRPSSKPTTRPSTKPTSKPTNSWTKPTNSWTKPTNSWTKPTNSWTKPTNSWVKPTSSGTSKPVTSRPYVYYIGNGFQSSGHGWRMSYGLLPRSALLTTPYHRPGLFAPVAPPKPADRNRIIPKTGFVLLPFDHNTQYTVIGPEEAKTDEPLLSIQEEEVKPLIEPAKDNDHLLPPHFDAEIDKISRSDDEAEDNLQYLSENVRELIRMANDPEDERVVDVWEGVRANNREDVTPKGKLSSSHLRLLLLYDLLSREAKRLRLSDYSGFSPDVMKTLVESSSGGARAQLSTALAKMVERKDCEHEYANNRAKEMVQELAKDESKLSSEIRYLQPLVYKL